MNTESLISIYEKFVQSKIQNSNVTKDKLFLQAINFESKKMYPEALNLYNLCKDKYPEDALVSLKIGSVLEHLKNKEQSTEIIIQTIKNKLITNYDALSAFNTHPTMFLERHLMANFILKNKEKILNEVENKIKIKKVNKKKCFVFWNNPQTAPDIVKVAIESQRENIGKEFEFVLLNDNNITDYVNIPEYIKNIRIENPTHFSDWLRTELLTNYGGVWLDATCFLTQDLSHSLADIKKQDCFFFSYKGSRVGSWFIYSEPNSYILNVINVVLNLWWEKQGYLTNYFMYHDIVEMLYWTDTEYQNKWDKMNKIHPNKALQLNKNLDKPFNLENLIHIYQDYFLHKLTYKVKKEAYDSNTFIKALTEDKKYIFRLCSELKQQLKGFKKAWIYKDKINVLEFEIDELSFAYDIYLEQNQINIDLVARNKETIKKISIFDNKEKLSIISTSNISDCIDKVTQTHTLILDGLKTSYKYDVSIILTSYNRKNIIAKALLSLKNQSPQHYKYQVLIIDDHSTDGTIEFIEDFIKNNRLNHFELIKKPYNSGNPAIPRNDGIFLAQAKYVLFVDSDDYIDPNTVYNSLEIAEKNNSDIVFLKIGSNSGGRKGFGENVFKFGNVDKASFDKHMLWTTPQIFHLFKKDFLIKNRVLFNPLFKKWEDLVFISKAMSKTEKYSILADKTYYFLEDFQGDNLTFKDLDLTQQCEIILESLNHYQFSKNSIKYSCFINRLNNFIIAKLKSPLISNKEKIYMLDLFKRNLDLKLINFDLILKTYNPSITHLIVANDFHTILEIYK